MDVVFAATPRDVSIWDTATHAWVPQSGEFGVMVGASVLDIRQTGSVTL